MRMRNVAVWSVLFLLLFSSCDEKIVEEENHVSPDYTSAFIHVFKKTESLNASNISPETKPDLFVNRDFYVGESNLYVINNVVDHWAIEVFDRNTLEHKAKLRSWTEGETSKRFSSTIFGISENKNRLYVTNSSQVQIFDTTSFEFIARAGTGVWWGDPDIILTNGFAAYSFKDKLFVRDRYNLVVFKESDLVKGKPQSEIKVLARTEKGQLSDMAYSKQHLCSMLMYQDLIYLSDAGQKKLFIFDPNQIKAAQAIPIYKELQLSERPLSLSVFQDKLYILCVGGRVFVYDTDRLVQTDKLVGIDQYVFESTVNRFEISPNGEALPQLFINDMVNKEINVGLVENVEIKIYD